jgi:hypothetical protein
MDSPHISRQLDHPIDPIGPIKRRRLKRLSRAERAELNRQLKDAMEAGLIRPSQCELGSPILLYVSRLMARCDSALTTVDLTRLRVRTLARFRVWTTPSIS